MKRFLLFSFFLTSVLFSYSQVFEMRLPDQTPVAAGDTVYIDGNVGDDLLTAYIYLKNVSAQSQGVFLKKTYVYIVPGTENAFCWGVCTTAFVSPDSVSIASGATNTDFSADYMPFDSLGSSIIRYTFFTTNNDSTWFIVRFNVYPTDIESNNKSSVISNPFPNPVTDNINYFVNDLQGQMSVNIYDLTGKTVKSVSVTNNGLVQISVSELKKGVYFAEVMSGNRPIKTNRILIR